MVLLLLPHSWTVNSRDLGLQGTDCSDLGWVLFGGFPTFPRSVSSLSRTGLHICQGCGQERAWRGWGGLFLWRELSKIISTPPFAFPLCPRVPSTLSVSFSGARITQECRIQHVLALARSSGFVYNNSSKVLSTSHGMPRER